MFARPRVCFAVALAVLIVGLSPRWLASARQAVGQSASDIHPMLSVQLTGAFGRGGATGSMWLLRDTWSEVTLFAGERQSPSTTLCSGGLQMAAPGAVGDVPHDRDPAVAWHVAARLVEFTGDVATIDLRWRRDPRTSQIEPATAHETEVRWKVPEGGRTVLDAVHAPTPHAGSCASAAVTAEFAIGSAVEFAHAALAYDAWVVQSLPSGETRTHHVRTSGGQGEAVTMMFPLMPLDGVAGPVSLLDLQVRGEIRGRLRTDGTIEVSVDVARYVMTREASMATGTAGRSHLRMDNGETVEFVPAPLHGTLQGYDLEEVMSGAPTAIRIRASRLW